MSVSKAIEEIQATNQAASTSSSDSKVKLPYIKDWHLVLQSQTLANFEDRQPYLTPDIFRDDWLNNDVRIDDFRFCYAGVKGSFTPLHRDVYTSYSWSANIVGTKTWRLFPPESAPLLHRNPSNRQSERIYDVRNVDGSQFPGWEHAKSTMCVVEQTAGETIFIPSNWHHQVENDTDCISLNHNWCNAVNLPSLYEAMKEEVEDVSHAISDVKQMLRHAAVGNSDAKDWEVEWLCQVDQLVKMDAGWGWIEFFDMIAYNLAPRTVSAPSHLRPSHNFVHAQARLIVGDFILREEYTKLPGVGAIVDKLAHLLLGISCDGS